MMKIRVEQQYDFSYAAYDANEYDGAPDAGPQLVGFGKTEEDAKADFMDQRMEREARRDAERAIKQAHVWDQVMTKLFGGQS